MITLVHASDVHFGKPHDPRAAAAFVRAAEAAAPDALVVSGDFTQRAKVAEYRQAADFLESLPDVPTVVTPGNHDVPLYRVWERLFAPFRNYREFISEDLDTVTRIPGCTLVSLNTAAPRTAIVNGSLSPGQIRFAQERFGEGDERDLRIVVAHHQLAPPPDYEGGQPMPHARRHLESFERMGVDVVLGGHLHRAYIGNSLDVLPRDEERHPVVIVQSGTTSSSRGRAREKLRCSFNVLRVNAGTIEVAHHHYDRGDDAFRPTSLHVFPRRPSDELPTGAAERTLDALRETG
jgi:3',5'-cyclic AMP phosphodiesterase CpdA